MTRALFVTGTDTDVGKTTAAVALMEAAARSGRSSACMKPAESGCARQADGTLVPQDAIRLQEACSLDISLDLVCPYAFELAAAPLVAARREGKAIDIERLLHAFGLLRAKQPDLLIVEGAGGLLVPYTRTLMAADIACQLGLPVVIVARPTLGTINHTLLTIEAARTRGLRVLGLLFSCTTPDVSPSQTASNAEQICHRQEVPYLGCLPFRAEDSEQAFAAVADQALDTLMSL